MAEQNRIPLSEISALILAGGRGSRMGGKDKGLIPIAGKPAIEHVLERIRPQLDTILISANRNLDQYARYGYPLVQDMHDDFPGPLAGMASGLAACETEYLLSLPVDAPLVNERYAERMKTSLEQSGKRACAAEFNGRLEPVFCLLHCSYRKQLLYYLEQGKRSVSEWLTEINAGRVDFSDTPDQFINLNLERDQKELAEHLRG